MHSLHEEALFCLQMYDLAPISLAPKVAVSGESLGSCFIHLNGLFLNLPPEPRISVGAVSHVLGEDNHWENAQSSHMLKASQDEAKETERFGSLSRFVGVMDVALVDCVQWSIRPFELDEVVFGE